jgi:hypothetical protein
MTTWDGQERRKPENSRKRELIAKGLEAEAREWRGYWLLAVSKHKLAATIASVILTSVCGGIVATSCNVARAAYKLRPELVDNLVQHVAVDNEIHKGEADDSRELHRGMERMMGLVETLERTNAKRDEAIGTLMGVVGQQGKQQERLVGLVDDLLKERRRASQ